MAKTYWFAPAAHAGVAPAAINHPTANDPRAAHWPYAVPEAAWLGLRTWWADTDSDAPAEYSVQLNNGATVLCPRRLAASPLTGGGAVAGSDPRLIPSGLAGKRLFRRSAGALSFCP
jgi:hypothetical protein